MRNMTGAIGLATCLASAGVAGQSPKAKTCEALAGLSLKDARITSATVVAAGAFAPPTGGRGGGDESFSDLAAFCRAEATLTPSTDSDIKVEIWLPVDNWNGKYQGVGNGGWAGSVNYPALRDGLARGYAVSSTDTGHRGGDATFVTGHPEKLIDFAYRAVHEMTVQSKQVVTAFYGRSPAYSYWTGCSAGGRQALKEIQRYPADFDGVVAGAPALDWIGRTVQALRIAQTVRQSEGASLPAATHRLVHDAVMVACDAKDGVKDGVLEDPRLCTFDPAVLECRNGQTSGCLTPGQVASARAIYHHSQAPGSNRRIASLYPGSELGWGTWAGPQPFRGALEHFRSVVRQDPAWDVRAFDFDRDAMAAERLDNGLINAMETDLAPFFRRGGKVLHYHGWSDPQISPGNSLDYHAAVSQRAESPEALARSYRLFMVPGMAHCGGGEGPNEFDMLEALEAWVERGQAPTRVIASRLNNGVVERTRPLCSYPQVARYGGTGSTDAAANFVCAAP